MKNRRWFLVMMMAALLSACGHKSEPEHVTVQHILIAFAGSIPKPEVTRTQEEARMLAREIYQRARGGENFDQLVKQNSDDTYPGIYKMANRNLTANKSKDEYPRANMVKAFGDASFNLPVNGIGVANYDKKTSPYGWHIIKRIE